MRKAGFIVLGAALTLTAGMVATAQNKGTIKIASQSPLSGPQSQLGEAIKLGVQLAVRDFGKVVVSQGFKLEYQPEDDQATPTVGTANANRLVNDPDLLAVVGHLNSGVARPSSLVYDKVGLASVSPANTAVDLTERGLKTYSRICGRDDVQGPTGARYLTQDLKAKTFFVVNDKTAYGQGVADAFAGEVKKLGGTVMENTGIPSDETDFSAVLNRVAALKPDVVYYGGLYPQAGPMLKQMREKGITSIFSGADGLDSSDFETLAGKENLNGVIFTTTAVPLSQFALGKKFAADYQKAFGKPAESYSIYGYDATRVVLTGIANAIRANKGARPSRQAVAAAIRKVDLVGLTGHIQFNSKGDLLAAKYVVLKIGADGYRNAKIVKVLTVQAPGQ